MNDFILDETPEEIIARKDVKKDIVGAARAIIWGGFLTLGTYFLFDYWGASFPVISWATPFIFPLYAILGLAWLANTKRQLVFTPKFLIEKPWSQNKVKWRSVKRYKIYRDKRKPLWLISGDPRGNEWLTLEFQLTFNRKKSFRIHESQDLTLVKKLIKDYGKL